MPKLHPLSKVELYSLATVVLLGAATGLVWAAFEEVANARRELRTARLDLAHERSVVEELCERIADAKSNLNG